MESISQRKYSTAKTKEVSRVGTFHLRVVYSSQSGTRTCNWMRCDNIFTAQSIKVQFVVGSYRCGARARVRTRQLPSRQACRFVKHEK